MDIASLAFLMSRTWCDAHPTVTQPPSAPLFQCAKPATRWRIVRGVIDFFLSFIICSLVAQCGEGRPATLLFFKKVPLRPNILHQKVARPRRSHLRPLPLASPDPTQGKYYYVFHSNTLHTSADFLGLGPSLLKRRGFFNLPNNPAIRLKHQQWSKENNTTKKLFTFDVVRVGLLATK